MKDVELYKQNNFLQRYDAAEVLKEYKMRIHWKEQGDRVLDVGCGDGGVTVDLLKQHMPVNFERLLGCDINESLVEHTNKHHRDYRTEFSVLDIEGLLPDELIGKFDHVFSFYTLNWVRQQEKAFKNIYNLLDKDGDCLLIFAGYMSIYDVWRDLSKQQKWSTYMKDIEKYVSPYHDCVEPETEVRKLMERAGFREVDVQCRDRIFVFDNAEILKKIITALNPFTMPSNLKEEFLEEIVKGMQLVARRNSNVENNAKVEVSESYVLIIALGKKQSLM